MADSQLVVRFEALGQETTRVESWSIDSDYLVSTDGFEFELLDDNVTLLQDIECQPVELLLNGASQLLGRIDITERGDNGVAVTCRGRDYIADLVECNVDPTLTIKEGELLGEFVVRACSPIGITNIADESDVAVIRNIRTGRVISGIGDTKTSQSNAALPEEQVNRGRTRAAGKARRRKGGFNLLKLEDHKPDPGRGLYEFLKVIADRHGCTIQPSTKRSTVALSAPTYDQETAYQITRSRSGTGGNNNVVSAKAVRDFSSFPSMIIVQGFGSSRSGEGGQSSTALIDTWAEAQQLEGELARKLNTITWSGRRKPGDRAPLTIDKIYRLNIFRDEQARNAEQLGKAGRKLLAEHLKNTLVYTATLRGHIDPGTGAIWSIDTLVQVNDDIVDVHEKLWVMKRVLKYAPGSGATTDIVAVRPGSFEPDGEPTNLSIAQFNSINGLGS